MWLGAFLAALLADLFRLMGQLGAPGRVLGVPWGAHGDHLGSSWGSPGRLGVLLELLGCGLGVSWGRHGIPLGCSGLPLGWPGLFWAALGCSGLALGLLRVALLGCSGLLWAGLGCCKVFLELAACYLWAPWKRRGAKGDVMAGSGCILPGCFPGGSVFML